MFDQNTNLYNETSDAFFKNQFRELAAEGIGRVADLINNERSMISFRKYSIEERGKLEEELAYAKSRLPSGKTVFQKTYLEDAFKTYWDRTVNALSLEGVKKYEEDIREVALHGMKSSEYRVTERVFSIAATFALEEYNFRKKRFVYGIYDTPEEEAVALESFFGNMGLNAETQKKYEIYITRALESEETDDIVEKTLGDVQSDVNKAGEKSALIRNVARHQNKIRERVEGEIEDKLSDSEEEKDTAPENDEGAAPPQSPDNDAVEPEEDANPKDTPTPDDKDESSPEPKEDTTAS